MDKAVETKPVELNIFILCMGGLRTAQDVIKIRYVLSFSNICGLITHKCKKVPKLMSTFLAIFNTYYGIEIMYFNII